MKKVLLLGSTGSIGISTENCLKRYPDHFSLIGIAFNRNIKEGLRQLAEMNVGAIGVSCEDSLAKISNSDLEAVIYRGTEGLQKMAEELDYDIMVNALVGSVGFGPTTAALKRGKTVALANKESLVVGGEIVADLLSQYGGTLLPVDSEHSAIFQCLNGEEESTIESMTITASGGPFRELPADNFSEITVETALKHPTWAMGAKITIDSSTLMNKGFEVIEAHHIFKIPYEKISVLVHPQSIIHSMVTFHDGSVMAQCGLPDMELPIQYALSYPKRLPIESKRLSLSAIGNLSFFEPDMEKFPCLALSLQAGKEGGTMPTVLNASNEVAVELFLNRIIQYTDISKIVDEALQSHIREPLTAIEQVQNLDREVRKTIYAKYKR